MNIQKLLIAICLPAVLAMTGCEAEKPLAEANPETVVATAQPASPAAAAPASKFQIFTPATTNQEHCDKHKAGSGHDCAKHCAKHKGKMGKKCKHHCDEKALEEHDCVKHCAEHQDKKDKICAKHCDHHHEHKADTAQ
jgi:hypothetical protein